MKMNNDIKGMCLFLGMIGLGYVVFLVLLMAFTGVKILKSILFITMLSSMLVSLGLTPQVKTRLKNYARMKLLK